MPKNVGLGLAMRTMVRWKGNINIVGMKVKLDTVKLFYRLILQGEPLFKAQQTTQIGKGVYCTCHEYGLL